MTYLVQIGVKAGGGLPEPLVFVGVGGEVVRQAREVLRVEVGVGVAGGHHYS